MRINPNRAEASSYTAIVDLFVKQSKELGGKFEATQTIKNLCVTNIKMVSGVYLH
jgi:hypothetical protein